MKDMIDYTCEIELEDATLTAFEHSIAMSKEYVRRHEVNVAEQVLYEISHVFARNSVAIFRKYNRESQDRLNKRFENLASVAKISLEESEVYNSLSQNSKIYIIGSLRSVVERLKLVLK